MFPSLQRFLEREHARALLLLGIAVRVLTYFFLSPQNNDSHAEMVRFIVDNGRLPSILETPEAQNPPLYYVLAAPLWAWSGSLKVVQLLSLACSIATLIVLYHLIYREGLLESAARFLFPVLFGGLGAFFTGVATGSGSRLPAVILDSSMYLLLGLFGLYFASEIGLRLLQMNPALKTLIESFLPGG